MFNAIKAPFGLVAVLALSAACSSGVGSAPSVSVPTASAPAVSTYALPASASVQTGVSSYEAAPAYTTYSQPAAASYVEPSLQAPLMIEAPVTAQTFPSIGQSAIEPASAVTFTGSPSYQTIPVSASSFSPPSLPSYDAPVLPNANAPVLPSYTAPAIGADTMLQPILPQQSVTILTGGYSLVSPDMVPTIARTSNARESLPIVAAGSPLLDGTVYGTSHGQSRF